MNTAILAVILGGVAVTTQSDLKFDLVDREAALGEWRTQHLGKGDPTKKLAQFDLPLRFSLNRVVVPTVSAFSPLLQGYLQKELDRGWRVTGMLDAPRPDGSRRATFTRRHARWGYTWPVHGVAKPVACPAAHAKAQGCFLAEADGAGVVSIKLGAPGNLRLTPQVLVAIYEKAGKLSAETAILALLQKGDADRVTIPPGELGDNQLATLTTILQASLGKAGSAWRFEGRARFSVKPVMPKLKQPEKKLNRPDRVPPKLQKMPGR